MRIRDSGPFITLVALFFLPFHNSPVINFNVFDVTGLKPFTILMVAAIAAELARPGPWRFRDSTERAAILWYVAYLLVFLVVFARSIPHLPIFHAELPDQFRDSGLRYFLSYFARPALSTCLFALIIRQFRTEREIDLVRRTLGISMAALSVAVLAIIVSTPDISLGTRGRMAATFERYLGLHYNSLGTIYIVTAPLVLYSALGDRVFPKVNAILAAIVIAALRSRSALVIFWLESLALLLVLRKGMTVFVINAITTAAVYWFLPRWAALGSMGLSGGGVDVDGLLSGRIRIWAPLLSEWIADSDRLLWGAGRYGILVSTSFRTGAILPVTHAHNAFIDLFLDAGLVGVTVVVVLVAAGLWRLWRVGRSIRDPMFWVLALGLCGYLVGTLTERGFFPNYDNLLVFPVLALLVNVARSKTAAMAALPAR